MHNFIQLRQTGSVQDYRHQFETAMYHLLALDPTLSTKFFISQFLIGLKDELRLGVRLQAPTSITRAAVFARIQEEELEKQRTARPRITPVGRPPPAAPPAAAAPATQSRPCRPADGSPPLSPARPKVYPPEPIWGPVGPAHAAAPLWFPLPHEPVASSPSLPPALLGLAAGDELRRPRSPPPSLSRLLPLLLSFSQIPLSPFPGTVAAALGLAADAGNGSPATTSTGSGHLRPRPGLPAPALAGDGPSAAAPCIAPIRAPLLVVDRAKATTARTSGPSWLRPSGPCRPSSPATAAQRHQCPPDPAGPRGPPQLQPSFSTEPAQGPG